MVRKIIEPKMGRLGENETFQISECGVRNAESKIRNKKTEGKTR
jgi:hypothetical protein